VKQLPHLSVQMTKPGLTPVQNGLLLVTAWYLNGLAPWAMSAATADTRWPGRLVAPRFGAERLFDASPSIG
jgi:hypothetical protein